jgi:2'-5' RNA ligase
MVVYYSSDSARGDTDMTGDSAKQKVEAEKVEVHRLFIAISLPEKVKSEIEKAQNTLRRAMPIGAVRWTKPEQFHLTLKFLGGVPVSQTEALTEAVREVCKNFSPLKLRAEGIGFFPTEKKPRVTWVGIRDRERFLPKLQMEIERAVKKFTTQPPEKSFTGHMTLGRAKEIERKNAEILFRAANPISKRFFGGWTATEVEIIRSDLSSDGSLYHRLATIPLSANTPAEEQGGVEGVS